MAPKVDTNWTKKCQAFLSTPPCAAIAPDVSVSTLISAACGTPFDPDELALIKATARGLDIPPWVDGLARPDVKAADKLTLRHPLSGNEYPLDLPGGLNQDVVEKTLVGEVAKIHADAGRNSKKTFLLLWRVLADRLNNSLPGILWEHLPADPRVPTHAWWEHASVASAIASASPKPAVFLFTIASAQDFVSQARRTQDTWMGSYLLSFLTWKAIQYVAKEYGPDAVLMPSLRGQPLVDWWLCHECGLKDHIKPPDWSELLVGSIPNIFTALVPADHIQCLGEKLEKEVSDSWGTIAKDVREAVELASLKGKNGVGYISSWNTIWARQIPDLPRRLGMFWASSPWEGAERLDKVVRAFFDGREPQDAYLKLFAVLKKTAWNCGMAYPWLAGFAGRALSARKNVRDFGQSIEPDQKCTLCGTTTALHPGSVDGGIYRELNDFWQKLARIDRNNKDGTMKLQGRLRGGDRLCAICLTKRLALEAHFKKVFGAHLSPEEVDHHLFPSTSSVATAGFLLETLKKAREDKNLRQGLIKYGKAARDALVGAGILYPASHPEAVKAEARNILEKHADLLLDVDGDWLYPSTYNEKSIEREFKITRQTASKWCFDEARKAAQGLLKCAAKQGIQPPSSYYAVMAFDGDRMSHWLTGKAGFPWDKAFPAPTAGHIPGVALSDFKNRHTGPAMQAALSHCLETFALKLARPSVTQHGGALIYAGGDDLLALFPVRWLYETMHEVRYLFTGGNRGWLDEKDTQIRALFPSEVNGGKRLLFRLLGGEGGMSISMGVVIAHRTHDLSQTVRMAYRIMKDDAKKALQRDAFSFALVRRSGELTTAGAKFETAFQGSSAPILPRLQEIRNLMAEQALSPRIAYRLRECQWAPAFDSPLPEVDGPLRPSFLHLVQRHTRKRGDRRPGEACAALYDALPAPGRWDTLGRLLLITSFLVGRGE